MNTGPALLLLLALFFPLSAFAEAAIGRLNHAGYRQKRHCTAVLIAPDIALTATHCLAGLDPHESHLLLGYDRGSWREHLRPRAAQDLGQDLTALCLTTQAKAAPLPLADQAPQANEPLVVSGYGSPSVHRLNEKVCRAPQVGSNAFRLDCPLAPGNSGGPVLRRTAEGDAVVGIVSASNKISGLAIWIGAAKAPHLCTD